MKVHQNANPGDNTTHPAQNNFFRTETTEAFNQKSPRRIPAPNDHNPDNIPVLSVEKIKKSFNFHLNLRKYSDAFNLGCNMLSLTLLYFQHFWYIDNGLELTPANNGVRIFALVLSLLVCVSTFIKYYNEPYFKDLEFQLKLRKKAYNEGIKYKLIIIIFFIELVQPYPFLHLEWRLKIMRKEVVYNIDMILLSISLLKLYSMISTINKWAPYADSRSNRVRKFYRAEEKIAFICKSMLKAYLFITVIVILTIFLYLFSLLFKIFENFSSKNRTFSYFSNCIWYLVVTVNTVGYGDYVPETLIGRIIGVLVCIFGIFVFSLFVVSFTIFLDLDDSELNFYDEVEKFELQEMVCDDYHKIYLEYLIKKFKKSGSPIDLLMLKNKLIVQKNSKINELRFLERKVPTLSIFNKRMEVLCDEAELNIVLNQGKLTRTILRNSYGIMKKSYKVMERMKYSRSKCFASYNLALFSAVVGNVVHIEGNSAKSTAANELKGNLILKEEDVNLRVREFYYKNKLQFYTSEKKSRKVPPRKVSKFHCDIDVVNKLSEDEGPCD